jgi:hypothetical protein
LLSFALDTNVLSVVKFIPALPGMSVGALAYSKGVLTVPVQMSGLSLSGETLLGWLRCAIYLSDTLTTSVTTANPSIDAEDTRCLTLSKCPDSVNITIEGCGEATLFRFMKDGTFPTAIASMAPNPVTSSLVVRWNGGNVTYDITDALGILREHHLATSGQSEIDVRSWPSGVYYIRARGANGMTSMRRFVVAK